MYPPNNTEHTRATQVPTLLLRIEKMIKNIINEDEIFEINDDYHVNVENYNGVKVVIVDDFYKNPHDVRQLALDIPASYNRRIRGNNPALRVNAFYELSSMAWIYDQLSRQYFPEITQHYDSRYFQRSFMNATFMVNVMQTENLPPVCLWIILAVLIC